MPLHHALHFGVGWIGHHDGTIAQLLLREFDIDR